MKRCVLSLVLSVPLWTCTVHAQTVEFNRDIPPILSDKCFTCHGPDAANRKTKLRFDTESGAGIELREGRHMYVAGDPEHSEMVRRITSTDKAVRMPPAYLGRDKLSDKEIVLFASGLLKARNGSLFGLSSHLNALQCPSFPIRRGQKPDR